MNCPVCGSGEMDSILSLGEMPLSVLGLRDDPDRSVDGKIYPIEICSCRNCSHVFNAAYDKDFDQTFVGGCTMYNSGLPWIQHLFKMGHYVINAADGGQIVEIGAGNGEFARLCAGANYLAFEPTDDAEECAKWVPTAKQFFIPHLDVKETMPTVILMRHVLEHYSDPGKFLRELSDEVRRAGVNPYLVVEVPCVSNALRDLRIEDWVYEHPHHFTQNSLYTLARMNGWAVDDLFITYGGEVLVARLIPFGNRFGKSSDYVFNSVLANIQNARHEIEKSHNLCPGSVVLWGGAGKGATLINLLNLDIPVVDSDDRKCGKYVPGTPFKIKSPSVLHELKPDMVVVTTSWRVGDIADEIARARYPVGNVAHFCRGKLITYRGQ